MSYSVLPLTYDAAVARSKNLAILGSTGSIGSQTINVARNNDYRIKALACNNNIDLLSEQILEFEPVLVSVGSAEAAKALEKKLSELNYARKLEIMYGKSGNLAVATCPEVDTVVAAIVGFAGLEAVLAAIRLGRKIALANKETLVAAGELVMEEAAKHQASIIPVDSEHSAIWHCMLGRPEKSWNKILLTCSGGPFRNYSKRDLEKVTIEAALNHPTWNMGGKISIDSATLMNKGLELIEACRLFSTDEKNIEVLVHPQSIVHSMLNYRDGSTMALLSTPDMELPIHQALAFPKIIDRKQVDEEQFFTADSFNLTFEKVDSNVFPSLEMARAAQSDGGLMPLVYNAANEAANFLFRSDKIAFVTIFSIVAKALQKFHTLSKIRMASCEETVAAHFEVVNKILEIYS